VLIFFIHHIASSIQASNIVRNATEETEAAIKRLFPDELGHEAAPSEAQELLEQASQLTWLPVLSHTNGYVQSVDEEGLMELARDLDGIVRMEHGIGGFVARGAILVSIASDRSTTLQIDEKLKNKVNDRFGLGSLRTTEQDAGFGLRQIVDIALKALSPGINDTTTAIISIDHLGSLVAQLADRHLANPLRADSDRVRVIALRPSFEQFVTTAFDQIRVCAEGNAAVYLRMLTALTTIEQRTQDPKRIKALYQQRALISEAAERTLHSEYERAQVRQRVASVKTP
jgi:uncharacterized membrane protein